MSPELKAKWCEALRSGEYAQARESMERDGAFCCLGVLEVIEMGSVEHRIDGLQLAFPSDSFRERVGLPLKIANSLALMNDEGMSFKSIANEIQRRL